MGNWNISSVNSLLMNWSFTILKVSSVMRAFFSKSPLTSHWNSCKIFVWWRFREFMKTVRNWWDSKGCLLKYKFPLRLRKALQIPLTPFLCARIVLTLHQTARSKQNWPRVGYCTSFHVKWNELWSIFPRTRRRTLGHPQPPSTHKSRLVVCSLTKDLVEWEYWIKSGKFHPLLLLPPPSSSLSLLKA